MKGQVFFELLVYRRSDKEIIYFKLFTNYEYAGQTATQRGYYADKDLCVKITPIEVEE